MADKDIPAVDKEKSLLLAISQIEKEFGKGTIMRLGSNATVSDVPGVFASFFGPKPLELFGVVILTSL